MKFIIYTSTDKGISAPKIRTLSSFMMTIKQEEMKKFIPRNIIGAT